MNELKPCPFCGTRLLIQMTTEYAYNSDTPEGTQMYWLHCVNPNCRMAVETDLCKTEEEAIALWNDRYTEVES